jgi:hypothetical protein
MSEATDDYPNKLNVTPGTVVGDCNLKCQAEINIIPFQAHASILQKQMIEVVPTTKLTGTQLLVGSMSYTFIAMMIYCPSINVYNGSLAAAELILIFFSPTSSMCFFYCPITTSSSNTLATNMLREIITTVANEASDEGDVTTMPEIDLSSILLTNIPFYFGEDALNSQESLSILYFPLKMAIFISTDTLTTLQQLIATNVNEMNVSPSLQLFMNPQGFQVMGQGGELVTEMDGDKYMVCSPTNISQDMTTQTIPKPNTPESELMKELTAFAQKYKAVDIFVGLFAVAIMILASYGLNKFIVYLKGEEEEDDDSDVAKGKGGGEEG